MNTISHNTKHYTEQKVIWPQSGRHIMAQYDAENITVYQAYRSEIGHYAAQHQQFGGPFSFNRMSWIKPNFLWMMYRSGWGTKEGQEVTLAVTIPRPLFDEILSLAVPSTYTSDLYPSQEEWKRAVAQSNVRLQWDPDHGPHGEPLERKAIQLGLRGDILEQYARKEVVRIDDISEFVAEQRNNLHKSLEHLITPEEQVYIPSLLESFTNISLDTTT